MAVLPPRFEYSGVKTSDALLKTGAGYVHTVNISQADAAPSAGTIQIRDAVAAGGGTVIWEWNLTTAVFVPFTVTLDCHFNDGLYVDFTTTADVNVQVSFK